MQRILFIVPILAVNLWAAPSPAQAKPDKAKASALWGEGGQRVNDKDEKPRKPKPKPGPRDGGDGD